MNTLKLLDTVVLLTEIPQKKLAKGQVGAIVEILADGVYEVEFVDTKGLTLAFSAVKAVHLLKLQYALQAA